MKSSASIPVQPAGGIPRYRHREGPAFLSAGFRPFFLLAAVWAAVAVPLWLALLGNHVVLPLRPAPVTWHAHELIFGFASAAVAGFLLTAIPNWTGRMPLQNGPLVALAGLWAAGRLAMLVSGILGPGPTAAIDLAFPAVFLAVIAREIVAGRNFHNLPMLAALALLLGGNLLVHLEALDFADTAATGNRLGIATLVMLISLVGGRIIPSFTANWLARERRDVKPPSTFGRFDGAVLAITGATLVAWVIDPDLAVIPGASLAAGIAAFVRLARWRGLATRREPLLWVLHLGYAWVGVGFVLLADVVPGLPATAALHALTGGAIGTMTLAVMTRASLGHTGRPLSADSVTTTIYLLVTLAAALRVVAPLWGDLYTWLGILTVSGAAWSGAFGLFAVSYFPVLTRPRRSAAR
jgi:uncharacterized protein involved in response to NO